LLVGVVACVSTQVTTLAGFDPARRPTCAGVVQIYASPEAIKDSFIEIAYLQTGTTDPVSNDALLKNMREKAAQLGANGILLRGFGSEHSVGIGTGIFTAKPTAAGVAIWVPRDTVALWERCAAMAAADPGVKP